jgi:hypothetical protein
MSERPEATFQEIAAMGRLMGARQVFCWSSGRFSAAEAAILREVRDKKLYAPFAATWAEFCEYQLQSSRRTIDRTIALLNELGPAYFALARLTGLSAAEFRAISPAIKDNAIENNGETIPLTEENATRLTRVVNELRDLAATPHPDEDLRRATPAANSTHGTCPWLLDRIEHRFRGLLSDLHRFFKQADKESVPIDGILQNLRDRLYGFERDYAAELRRRREQTL